MNELRSARLSWCAGVFDVKGTVTVTRGRVRLAVRFTDHATGERYRERIGTGALYGPYQVRQRSSHTYHLWLAEGDAAIVAANQLWGFLSEYQRDRISSQMPSVNFTSAR